MKLKLPFVALALALAGGAASAATVGTLYDLTELNATHNQVALANGGTLGPDVYTAYLTDVQPTLTDSFDYVYNFALDSDDEPQRRGQQLPRPDGRRQRVRSRCTTAHRRRLRHGARWSAAASRSRSTIVTTHVLEPRGGLVLPRSIAGSPADDDRHEPST